jgi:hypothetical protein
MKMLTDLRIFYAPDDGAVGSENFNRYGYEGNTNSLQNYPDVSVEGGDEEELIILNPDDEELTDEEQAEREEQGQQSSQSEGSGDSGKTAEQIRQEMQQQQQSITQNLNSGFQSLAETLSKTFQNQNQPANSQQQNPEKIKEEFEKGLFEDGKTYDTFVQGVNQAVGPYLQQMQQHLVNQERELLSVEDKTKNTFNKYQKEIDDLVQSLPQNQQITPGVYKWAHQQIVSRHVDDLQSEAVNSTLQEKLDKIGYTLDENGEPVPKQSGNNNNQSQSYSASTGNAGVGSQNNQASGPRRKTKRVRASQEDVESARLLDMSLSDYMNYVKPNKK